MNRRIVVGLLILATSFGCGSQLDDHESLGSEEGISSSVASEENAPGSRASEERAFSSDAPEENAPRSLLSDKRVFSSAAAAPEEAEVWPQAQALNERACVISGGTCSPSNDPCCWSCIAGSCCIDLGASCSTSAQCCAKHCKSGRCSR